MPTPEDRYPYRMPRDAASLSAIVPSDRERFDTYQRRIFIAYQARLGDKLGYRAHFRELATRSGRVDAILTNTHGELVFAIDGLAVGVWDLADVGYPLWHLLPGDVVEVKADGQWQSGRIKAWHGCRQWPTHYTIEGSRRHFYPGHTLRLPVSIGAVATG